MQVCLCNLKIDDVKGHRIFGSSILAFWEVLILFALCVIGLRHDFYLSCHRNNESRDEVSTRFQPTLAGHDHKVQTT